MRTSYDAIVIGAGIHGCSVAMQLSMRKLRVLVIEKTYPGRHASGVNAGSVHHIPRLTPELPLAELTLRMWHDIGELVDGEDCGYRQVGHLKIAETEDDVAPMNGTAEGVARHCNIEEIHLDREALFDREPGLSRNVAAGIFSPECGYAQPARAVHAFRAKAERLGAVFLNETCVVGLRRSGPDWLVDTSAGPFDAPMVVNCAGAWGSEVASWVGDHVTLRTVALMMSVLAPMKPVMETVIGLTRRLLSIKQFENGTVVIGGGYRGTPDLVTGRTMLDYTRLGYNLRAATEVFPALARGRVVRCWSGIEGISPDALPIIGPSASEDGIWHSFAYSTHGFYLGPAAGRVLAEAMTGERPAVSLEPFHIGRFNSPDIGAA